MFPKLKEMIETEQVQKEQARRKARFRERNLEFARIYLSRGVSANEPEEGPFMMPSYGIFEDDPQVQALLTEDDCKVPFTEDRYERIEDLIAEGVIKYNVRARRDLARMHGFFVLGGQDEGDADEQVIKPFLARATTVFHLDSPPAPKCLSYKILTEIFHLATVYWMPEIGVPPTWNIAILGVTPAVLAGKITRELLRVVGAPESSTWEQMKRICGKRGWFVRAGNRVSSSLSGSLLLWVSSHGLSSSQWVKIFQRIRRFNISDTNVRGLNYPKPRGIEMKA